MGGFKAFLKEYGVIGLALGVIIGSKAGELVNAIVDGILMPPIGPALGAVGSDWQKVEVGVFKVGVVLAAFINFIIVALFVYIISKVLLKEKDVAKK